MKEFHPLANIFPLVEGPEFADLVADIREHGLHEPIVMFEDRVLDGRNRLRACEAAGIEPVFTVYTGDDPVAFVVRINLHRRHLDESQRAMVAVKLATLLRAGDNQHSEGRRIGRSSELLNVGVRSVARAREVQEHGTPELVHAVERGAVSVSAAADVATLSAQEQREIVARGEREILRPHKISERGKRRFGAPNALSGWQQPVTTALGSQVIDAMRCFTLIRRGISKSTMKNPASSARPAITIPRCHSTSSALCRSQVSPAPTPHCSCGQRSRIFGSPSMCLSHGALNTRRIVWVKDKIGLGYFVRNQHELLLVATRGDMPSPSPGNRPPSVITAPRREHSRKPDEAYELIERMYPELPKLELFARQQRPGWAAWGNETSKFGEVA
jgi:ParB-like chromosome segregation protein Spo0J